MEKQNEKKETKTVNYTATWKSVGIQAQNFGINPAKTKAPKLCGNGSLLVYSSYGKKANVYLIRMISGQFRIGMKFLTSGKSSTFKISELNFPPFRTVAEQLDRMAEFGFFSLKQELKTNTVQMELAL